MGKAVQLLDPNLSSAAGKTTVLCPNIPRFFRNPRFSSSSPACDARSGDVCTMLLDPDKEDIGKHSDSEQGEGLYDTIGGSEGHNHTKRP